jgi:hypothetical protein
MDQFYRDDNFAAECMALWPRFIAAMTSMAGPLAEQGERVQALDSLAASYDRL